MALSFWPTAGLVSFASYLLFCRSLRYLRRDKRHRDYPYKTREDFSRMTTQHAFEICKYCISLEFPFTIEKALQFALFRTYGIPTISKLLCETRQLSEVQYAPRRYADTSILITEFLSHAPESDRANSAIARMNFLHGMYQKSGKISNDDLLYTLSLFILEVERWVRMYEWRAFTPMELCAFGTLWKSIGDAMGITWEALANGQSGFKDGLQFVEDLRLWSDAYEKRNMVPNKWNHQLAEETIAILLCNAPRSMKPAGKQAVVTLMDERLRRAMIYDDPPSFYPSLVSLTLTTRKLFIHYLLPPRPYSMRFKTITDDPDPNTGRYHQIIYEAEPWYVPATLSYRFNLAAWTRWALGRPFPDGKNFKPQGYHIFELGPEKLESKGQDECKATRERLMASGRGGCPFSFRKA
ncbi:uncharacterized protein BDR25DRAFT_298370 [Lindgomyces ingoldianus]|uniref:Uncharacterized protein n=1 Tax=Lindgomyces ingoldianus TaxID=673940 RepID=A0ACB6QAI3_9PLEO|nr:uncharacterized protein BDR25DRAFT_298370 [Lindgomyces ingoldianus]KAF2463132.1 hypothetical protein BDR25DRAFT_298370 [Lindgomyces ingoldianus]